MLYIIAIERLVIICLALRQFPVTHPYSVLILRE